MSHTGTNGRLCNQIIRNVAVSFIAEKHNLEVKYSSHAKIRSLGIPLYSGTQSYSDTVSLREDNYYEIRNQESFSHNIDPNDAYFQTKEFCRELYEWFRTPSIRNQIVSSNPFHTRYGSNNDCFVHVRLGDVAHLTPGLEYYLNVLSLILFDRLYIASDSPSHPIVKSLRERYPSNSDLVYTDEVATIQVGSTCKHVVLSHGSFSAVIGYLAFESDVYYPSFTNRAIWHGDMFSIEGWREIK